VPELPEVEIAARNLRRWASGRTIVRAEADPGARYVFRPSTPATFARAIEGARFVELRRIGKQLLVTLEREGAPLGLLAHLGMTGKWLRRMAADDLPRFSRARLHLDDGAVLHLVDLRLFGRLRLVPRAHFEGIPELAALGPDPLEDGIDVERLATALARSKLPVKVRIMDQAILPGVGNILASEACFRARLDPRRRAADVSREEVARLARAVLEVVHETIAREDGPEIAYVEEGAANPFLVYAREGERCPRCRRATIERVVQAQRSTFFCPRCQAPGRRRVPARASASVPTPRRATRPRTRKVRAVPPRRGVD
jgi:formamidopyrimidine-DNA glycosylase